MITSTPDLSSEEKKNSYSLSDKESAFGKKETEDLSISQISKISDVASQGIADCTQKSTQILQTSTISRISVLVEPVTDLVEIPNRPFPELEQYLINFIKEKMDKKLMVSKKMIKSKAIEFCKKNSGMDGEKSKTSLSWIRKFFFRNCLTYRRVAHHGHFKIRDFYYEYEVVKQYLLGLNKITKSHSESSIYNMEDTIVFYDDLPTRTINTVKTTIELSKGSHKKNKFSIVITVRADGFLLPIGIIFEGLKKIPQCNIPNCIYLYVNESGTMDSKIMIVRILFLIKTKFIF